MTLFIAWNSPYIANLSLDQTTAEAYIDAAGKAMDRYTRRHLAQGEYDELLQVMSESIYLPAFPVDHVSRVMTERVTALTITNAAPVSTINTSNTALNLLSIDGGTRTSTALAYATYTTLDALTDAINEFSSQWTATVNEAYGDYPSSDLVAGQVGTAKNGRQLEMWLDGSGTYDVHLDRGEVCLYPGAFQYAWDDGDCPTYRRSNARVVYTGGFDPIPENLQYVCSTMVGSMFDHTEGAIASESLGFYSYTLATAALDRIPIDTRQLLDSYRDRIL